MTRAVSAPDAFWFVPGSATRLAVLRILIGAGALIYLSRHLRSFSSIAASSPTMFDPVGLAAASVEWDSEIRRG